MENNEILKQLPRHLMSLVIDQPYTSYTAQDHAVWRYVMRQNIAYLSKVAHGSYVDGLRKTGISIDEIPHMYGMNRILKDIGWAAVAVDGFIPPAAFMEFQAYNVLVIAADIRPIKQIDYTPAPDIIHEAAGHAPIIADPEYAEYLRYFGEIGHKAFSSKRDYQLYEAIRHLSILKADPYSKNEEILEATELLGFLERNMGTPSEMARIRNLHWWTVEYGLIGALENPKIYGAGLLSSIGESVNALSDRVIKRPYSIAAADVGFDITTMQPQLFVTPDFSQLMSVLEEFAETMAIRKGGLYAIEQARNSANVATAELSSGIQICGVFDDYVSEGDDIVYFKTSSPTILCHRNKVLKAHHFENHTTGILVPIGLWTNTDRLPEELSFEELKKLGLYSGNQTRLDFRSGVSIQGTVSNILYSDSKLLIISWKDCVIGYKGETICDPDGGCFDQLVGSSLRAAYTGPADPVAYGLSYEAPFEKTHKIIHTEEARHLQSLYQSLRELRSTARVNGEADRVWKVIKQEFPNEWLAPLELLEIIRKEAAHTTLSEVIREHLELLKDSDTSLTRLIADGLALLD